MFYENTADNAYATLIYAEYDNIGRRLRYANCGHLSALLFRSGGGIERLDSTCTVLGLFRDWDCPIRECQLCPGDLLLLYTDGVTESFDHRGNEFGEERLIEAVRRNCQLAPGTLLAAVLDDVKRFSSEEQYDDMTLVTARCRKHGE